MPILSRGGRSGRIEPFHPLRRRYARRASSFQPNGPRKDRGGLANHAIDHHQAGDEVRGDDANQHSTHRSLRPKKQVTSPRAKRYQIDMRAPADCRSFWAAIVLQAADDLRTEPYDSTHYSQSVAFFTGSGAWLDWRTTVADAIDLHPDDLTRLGNAAIALRHRQEPPPAPVLRVVTKPAPRPVAMVRAPLPKPAPKPPSADLQRRRAEAMAARQKRAEEPPGFWINRFRQRA